MSSKGAFFIQNKKFSADDLSLKKSFTVKSVPKPYHVVYNHSAKISGVINGLMLKKGNLLFIDKKVYGLLRGTLRFPLDRIFIGEATENFKTEKGVFSLIDFLRKHAFTKGEQLIVVGGGIIQDVAAFTCASYKRGVPWVYLPTTLLSMCDSCIGGKTGINYRGAKNQLALFSAPSRVIIMPEFLNTLGEREVKSGLGEIAKLCITGGRKFWDKYRKFNFSKSTLQRRKLRGLILSALSVKKAVVEKDEFELDLRRSLNYGHTIGHVLEAISNYRIPHGQAVIAGVIIANELSCRRGFLSEKEKSEMLPYLFDLLDLSCFKGIGLNNLESMLRLDKKNKGDTIILIIIESIGRMKFLPLKINASLIKEITQIIKKELRAK